VDEDNEDEVYPPGSAQLGFAVDFDDLPLDKARRCLAEFARPIEVSHIDELNTRVEAWFEALEDGGWALPLGHPTDVDSVRSGVCQFDETTAEIAVLCFRASEEAWNVLLNILAGFSQAVLPVTKVMIE
jgi:hypothetical protein